MIAGYCKPFCGILLAMRITTHGNGQAYRGNVGSTTFTNMCLKCMVTVQWMEIARDAKNWKKLGEGYATR